MADFPRSRRFIAFHELPPDIDRITLLDTLRREVRDAKRQGVIPIEAMVSLEGRRAASLWLAHDPQQIRDLHSRAGLAKPQVFEGEIIHTDVLLEPPTD